MSDIRTLEDVFDLGVLIVATLFAYGAVASIWAADTLSGSVSAFVQTLTVLLLILVPTNEFGIFLAIVLATVGAAIPVDSLDPKHILVILALGVLYTLTNIVSAWFTVSV